MSKRWILGYGSLLNLQSVQDTVPEIVNLIPCYVKGFKRDFSFWSNTGYLITNLDVAGIPFYALNVIASSDIDDIVNGVIFEVDDQQFHKLAIREQGYALIQTTAYDFQTGQPLRNCVLYSATPHIGKLFDFTSAAQQRYLQICIDGAKSHGTDFYQQFMATTNVNGQSLLMLAPFK